MFCQAVIRPVDVFLVEIALYLSAGLFAGYTHLEVLALPAGFVICFVNYAVLVIVKLLSFKHFSCRTDVAVTLLVINELPVAKSRVAIAAVTLMAYARRYALFMEIFVVFSGSVSFVGYGGFDLGLGICLMFVNNLG